MTRPHGAHRASVIRASRRALPLAFALLLPLAFAIPPTARGDESVDTAAPRAHLSQDARVNRAREMIHRGRHRDALIILRALRDPARDDITDIRFLIALAAIASARGSDRDALLAEAIAALRAILVAQPQLLRVRLELARAFFLNGDDDLARRHFELVLGADPPRAVVANVNRFLHAIRARQRWSGYFSVNLEQNDNINSGTDTRVIYLHGLPFTLNEESRPRRETGLSLAGGAEYQLPLAPRARDGGGRISEWRWRIGGDFSHAEYEDHELTQSYAQVRTGPRYQIGQRTQLDAQAHHGWRQVQADRHSRRYGLRLRARHRLRTTTAITAGAARIWVRHPRAERARDDRTDDYSLGASYLFTPLLQGNIGIGYERNHIHASGGSHARRASIGAAAILPRGWTLGVDHEWQQRNHRTTAPLTGGERQRDRRRTARILLLNRGFTLFGFSPQLVITNERQRSNYFLQEYSRTRADLRLIRQY